MLEYLYEPLLLALTAALALRLTAIQLRQAASELHQAANELDRIKKVRGSSKG